MTIQRNITSEAQVLTVKCKVCGSEDLFRYGYTNKGTQRYICTKCQRTFVDNKAPPRMRFPADAVASALNQFYESASLSKIQRQLELTCGVKPDRMTIYRWIIKYSQKATRELNNVPIITGSTWATGEVLLRKKQGKGSPKVWFHDIIDRKSRFLLASIISETRTTKDAQILFENAAKRAGTVPKTILTDRMAYYLGAVELAFGDGTRHVRSRKPTTRPHEQYSEPVREIIRDRTKMMRSFHSRDTVKAVLDGWIIHHNFFRPHPALGKTPAEAAGIDAPFKSWADVTKSNQ